MDVKYLLSEIIHERMKTRGQLDALRLIMDSGRYDSLINILLDKLSALNKLEKELTEKKEKK